MELREWGLLWLAGLIAGKLATEAARETANAFPNPTPVQLAVLSRVRTFAGMLAGMPLPKGLPIGPRIASVSEPRSGTKTESSATRSVEAFDWNTLKYADEEFRKWCEKHAQEIISEMDFVDAVRDSRKLWEGPDTETNERLRSVFFDSDGTPRVFPVTAHMVTEVRKIMATEGARKKSKLTILGDAAKTVAQRGILLHELEKHGWNLTRTAEALDMSAPSSVIIAIKELGLDAEYNTAKEKGLVSKGRRKTDE